MGRVGFFTFHRVWHEHIVRARQQGFCALSMQQYIKVVAAATAGLG